MEKWLEWLAAQGVDLIATGLIGVCKVLAAQSSLFVVVAIIGAYFLMLGNKETGNKIISSSVLAYFIVKVVSLSC